MLVMLRCGAFEAMVDREQICVSIFYIFYILAEVRINVYIKSSDYADYASCYSSRRLLWLNACNITALFPASHFAGALSVCARASYKAFPLSPLPDYCLGFLKDVYSLQ